MVGNAGTGVSGLPHRSARACGLPDSDQQDQRARPCLQVAPALQGIDRMEKAN